MILYCINLYQTLESFQTLLNARAKVPFRQVQWSRSLESSPRCVFSEEEITPARNLLRQSRW